jgi:benzylsuccinate CoA-transferase BbsF subunit
MNKLQAAGVAAGAVQNAGDLLERDPQLRSRGFLQDVTHPVLGTFGHHAPPYKLSRTPAFVRSAPKLGEHTQHVCVDLLGMSQDEFNRLHQAGVFA